MPPCASHNQLTGSSQDQYSSWPARHCLQGMPMQVAWQVKSAKLLVLQILGLPDLVSAPNEGYGRLAM